VSSLPEQTADRSADTTQTLTAPRELSSWPTRRLYALAVALVLIPVGLFLLSWAVNGLAQRNATLSYTAPPVLAELAFGALIPVGLVAAIVILVMARRRDAVTRTGPVSSQDHPWATYTLAATVAVVSCLVLLAAVFIVVAGRVLGLYYSSGPFVELFLIVGVVAGLAGLVAAVVIAILAAVRRPSGVQPAAPGAIAAAPARRRVVLLGVAAVIVAASILLFLMFDALSLGYGVLGKLVQLGAAAVAVAGVVATVIVLAAAMLPGRATSLRTRAFGVIVMVVLIPSFCLAALGVWAYYRSWEAAESLYTSQASYRAQELNQEIGGLSRLRYLTPAERAALSRAIVEQFSVRGHSAGALRGNLSAVLDPANHVLPGWAIRSLRRDGYAIGVWDGPSGNGTHIAAWRVPNHEVYYYTDYWGDLQTFQPTTPVTRLVKIGFWGVALIIILGLLGAWILSRSVVRPVRRLAEASGRLAEGEAGVTVTPQGPKELRELAVSFNDMNAKLMKAQETEQAFLLSVSHELKTPLTSIRGYAEGIDDGTVEPDEGAAVIGAESGRLERLVGDLLESGRMRKAAFTVRREPVDLVAVADDVLRRYEGTARDAGLTLLLNTEAGGQVIADHDRALQVVSNLVENAIRCTPAPGTVTLTTAPGSITVADTGRGLTSDDLPRAFERFYLYSRYGTDRPVGTGLGLAIVKELTEAMGGTVQVSSAVGVGTAFTVTLPQDPDALPEEATSVTAATTAVTAAGPLVPPAPAAPPAPTTATPAPTTADAPAETTTSLSTTAGAAPAPTAPAPADAQDDVS
jgi:signal transduction histidine kinase